MKKQKVKPSIEKQSISIDTIRLQKTFGILDYFFDVSVVENISRLIYAFVFFTVAALAVIGIKYSLYSGYFQLIVMLFITVLTFYLGDIKFSALRGAYWIPGIIMLVGFFLFVISDYSPKMWIHGAINYTLTITALVIIYKLIKINLRKRGKL